jgi:Type III flagellar switch regulator (C-ring) FliN C-term
MVTPFPFESLPRFLKSEVAMFAGAAAWLAAELALPREVLGVSLSLWRRAGVGRFDLDSSAALVWLVRDGVRALVSLPGDVIRELTRRLLAAPLELSAPRPLTSAEHAVAAMACASALAQAKTSVQVEPWQPFPELRTALEATARRISGWPCLTVGLQIDGRDAVLRIWVPPSIVHQRPQPRLMGWLDSVALPVPIVVAAAPIDRQAWPRLAIRDVVVVDVVPSGAELRVGRGAIALRVALDAVHGLVESGYVRKVMDPLADDLTIELTVALGTVSLSLRQISELSVGQVVSLGRPLQGPFELRVAGKVIGSGQLVDVEGGLGVQVTSLNDS